MKNILKFLNKESEKDLLEKGRCIISYNPCFTSTGGLSLNLKGKKFRKERRLLRHGKFFYSMNYKFENPVTIHENEEITMNHRITFGLKEPILESKITNISAL